MRTLLVMAGVLACAPVVVPVAQADPAPPIERIGREQRAGGLTVMHVETDDAVVVFVHSRSSCDVAAASVTLRWANGLESKVARFRGCGLRPVKVEFPSEGRRLVAIHVEEYKNFSS